MTILSSGNIKPLYTIHINDCTKQFNLYSVASTNYTPFPFLLS